MRQNTRTHKAHDGEDISVPQHSSRSSLYIAVLEHLRYVLEPIYVTNVLDIGIGYRVSVKLRRPTHGLSNAFAF